MGLLLHCGSDRKTMRDVAEVRVPDATRSWQPIRHTTLIDLAKKELGKGGYTITDEAHALRNGYEMPEAYIDGEQGYKAEGAHYFGLLSLKAPRRSRHAEIAGDEPEKDYSLTMGLRNAMDQSFSAKVALGARVLVCDNMSFSGEVVIGRKHTTNIITDLPRLMADAILQLREHEDLQDRRFACYKDTLINDPTVHDLVIRAMDQGAISASKIPALLHEWREPALEVWRDEPRSCWRLHNAFTETFKQIGRRGPVWRLPERSRALHSVLDKHVSL